MRAVSWSVTVACPNSSSDWSLWRAHPVACGLLLQRIRSDCSGARWRRFHTVVPSAFIPVWCWSVADPFSGSLLWTRNCFRDRVPYFMCFRYVDATWSHRKGDVRVTGARVLSSFYSRIRQAAKLFSRSDWLNGRAIAQRRCMIAAKYNTGVF